MTRPHPVPRQLSELLNAPHAVARWSPDDSKLLFQRGAGRRSGGWDLVTVDLSTDGPGCPTVYSEEVLVPVTGKKRNPVWGTYPQWRR